MLTLASAVKILTCTTCGNAVTTIANYDQVQGGEFMKYLCGKFSDKDLCGLSDASTPWIRSTVSKGFAKNQNLI